MPLASLEEVLVALHRQVPNDLALAPLCTRIMLRTGVNLRSPRQDQLRDSAMVGKVVSTLTEMGYRL
jgi:hypothetical protein